MRQGDGAAPKKISLRQVWARVQPFVVAPAQPPELPFALHPVGPGDSPPPAAHVEPLPHPESDDQRVGSDLNANLAWLERQFHMPANRGLVMRRLALGQSEVAAAVVYLDDQVDWAHLNQGALLPLLKTKLSGKELQDADRLVRRVFREGQVTPVTTWSDVVNGILCGQAAVLVDGLDQAVLVETKGWAKRSVDRPQVEVVVRGPQESFTEDIRSNLSQIRRRLRTADLMVEWGQLGRLSRTDIALIYLRSVANPRLVAEVRRRLQAIKVDYVADSGTVEQLIEDRPFSLYPSIASTERPDRVAAQVAEGCVAILVANTPFALILPSPVSMFLHTAEDAYLRWPYGTFLRVIRTASFFVALLLPALYLAVVNFHQEMLPTALMMAISSTRETVPLPVVAEVLVMEAMFELIREAGIRIPSVIGPTIGIVGALILGQAAVQANVVSPIMVIITAATALASFAIPNYSLQFATRILRFLYILAAATFGLAGLTLAYLAVTVYQAAGNTFGVPWLTPMAPARPRGDNVERYPSFQQEKRPIGLRPLRVRRQPHVIRTWDPNAPSDDGTKEE